MKKALLTFVALLAAFAMSIGLAACGDTETTYTVTFMYEDEVIDTQEVAEGGLAEEWTPDATEVAGEGYEFVDWFATPSKNHYFDFTTPITSDTTVYAGFTLFTEDTRTFYVLGSGTSELLLVSNWGATITEEHQLEKDPEKNEYTITMDLKEGDQFQFAIDSDWSNKRGYGYLATTTMDDGTEVFSGEGSPYDDTAKGSNIVCEYSGNYTLTLHTYPNEDYYNTSGSGYTEERKEIYNLGTYDKITWVRNGDVLNDTVTVTDFYIKGRDITGWANMYNSNTQMTNDGGTYTLSIYLKEGEEFMFVSRVTSVTDEGTEYSDGPDSIYSSNIAEDDTQTYVSASGNNMVANASGTYTFTYDSATKVLTVEFDADTVPTEYDYYIDGNFGGGDYGMFIDDPESYQLVELREGTGVYMITGIELEEGNELLIRSYIAGETADWDHTHIDYQYAYLAENSSFSAASDTNNNILVLVSGTYNISIDSYSKIITISEYDPNTDPYDTHDVYIKGSINDWADSAEGYKFTLSEDKMSYELTITLEANAEFGINVYNKGSTSATFLKTGVIGSDGDANSLFVPEGSENVNFVCSTAGTYRIVYNIVAGTIDFYTT